MDDLSPSNGFTTDVSFDLASKMRTESTPKKEQTLNSSDGLKNRGHRNSVTSPFNPQAKSTNGKH